MSLEIRRLTSALESDFWAVHDESRGEGWCCCTAWWVPTWEGFGQRTAEENRALRRELFARGEHDGYLGYLDGQPVAWCQCGPRDRLTKLARQYALAPEAEVWALTCFVVGSAWRGRGVARELLAGVLADLRRRGVRRVQAFPKCLGRAEPGEVWTGPEALFQQSGFRRVREHQTWPVYELSLS